MTDVSFTNNDAAYRRRAVRREAARSPAMASRSRTTRAAAASTGAAYLLGGSVVLTNTTVVGNGGAASLGGGIAQRGRRPVADQRHVLGQRSRLARDRTSVRQRASRTRSSARASRTAATAMRGRGQVGPSERLLSQRRAITTRQREQHRPGRVVRPRRHRATSPTPTRTSLRSPTTAGRRARRRCSPGARRSTPQLRTSARRPTSAASTATVNATSARSRPRSSVDPRPPEHQRGRHITDSSADLHGHDQPLGRGRRVPLRLGSVAGQPAQLDPGPRRRHRRERHVRDADALGPESRDHVLLQDRRRQLVRLHAGHRVGHQELHDAGRRRRRCSTSMQTRSPTRPPTSRSRSTRTAPTPATSSSTATQIRATIRPTDPIDIGADAGDQQLTATLQNLDPNSDYHFEVIATNSVDTHHPARPGLHHRHSRSAASHGSRSSSTTPASRTSAARRPRESTGATTAGCNTWCPTVCSQATKRTQPSTS